MIRIIAVMRGIVVSEAPLCGYRGCYRTCYQRAPGTYYQFCGRKHADMDMGEACKYDMVQYSGFGGYEKCRLAGCDSPAAVESMTGRVHDFCCKSHMLKYTTLSTAQYLKMGRLCKIDKCFRHVYVENGRCHDFCGLKHCRLAAAAEGAGAKVIRNRQPEGSGEEINLNSNQDQDSWMPPPISPGNQEFEGGGKYTLPYRDVFGHSGFDGGIGDHQLKDYLSSTQEKLLDELAQGTHSDSSPNEIDIFQGENGAKFQHINIFQGADISKFHPWEVVTELKPRYLLTITSTTKVTRQTRDGRCWKQTGPSYRKKLSDLNCKYFSYKHTQGKCVDSSKKRKKDSWTLHEYSLKEDIILAIAGQKGLGKSKIKKAVILKIARGDNSAPSRGEGDHLIPVQESSEGEVSDPDGQLQSPSPLDIICRDDGSYDNDVTVQQLNIDWDDWDMHFGPRPHGAGVSGELSSHCDYRPPRSRNPFLPFG